MHIYKRLITLIIAVLLLQMIFAITFAFYDISIKKLEMQSILTTVGELVEEDGYLDKEKIQIYTDAVLEGDKFSFEKDKLFISISDSDLLEDDLDEPEKPQKGQIVELGIHLETEPFKNMLPKYLSEVLVYDFVIPTRVVVQRWNKARPTLLNYYTGAYKVDVSETDIKEYIESDYISEVGVKNKFKLHLIGEGGG